MVTVFGVIAVYRAEFLLTQGSGFFAEPVIDVEAARTWLAGGDPWRIVEMRNVSFAGPPTMLIPYAAFSFIDPFLARLVLGVLGVAAALWAIHRLGLAIWWILWPPLFEAVMHASFDAWIPLLLLLGAGPLASFVKPYAVAGFAERPRLLLLTALLVLGTVPLLPWSTFLADLPVIQAHLQAQAASGGLSSWGNPLAMVVVSIALVVAWPDLRLVAPAGLWPYAQFHYGAMALQVASRSPILAISMALPVAGAAPAGIVAYALVVLYRRRRLLPNQDDRGRPKSRSSRALS
jgi:hypothetical protein